MISSAFVPAVPVSTIKSPVLNVSSNSHGRDSVQAAPVRRTQGIVMVKDNKKLPPPFPQGFTDVSETINGRAAMIGFLLAVVTEAMTGEGIVGQVSALFNFN